jgi:hypothetical protein
MRAIVIALAFAATAAVTTRALADDTATCLDAVGKGQMLRDGHKLVEARAEFRVCASSSCPVVVQRDCLRWVSDADASIPTIVLSAKEASGEDALEARVSIDGAATKLDGVALPINPGPHTFRFGWPDGASIERQVLVEEGQKAVVISVRHPPPLTAPPAAALVLVPPPPLAQPAAARQTGTLRLAGYVVGSAGLAAVVVGSIFGGLTFAEVSTAKTACGPAGCASNTSLTAVNDMQTARTYGNASTALLIGGGLLAAGGVAMVLVGGKKTEAAALSLVPVWTVRSASVGLQGTFR